jgi:hypothetical protein
VQQSVECYVVALLPNQDAERTAELGIVLLCQ